MGSCSSTVRGNESPAPLREHLAASQGMPKTRGNPKEGTIRGEAIEKRTSLLGEKKTGLVTNGKSNGNSI